MIQIMAIPFASPLVVALRMVDGNVQAQVLEARELPPIPRRHAAAALRLMADALDERSAALEEASNDA